MAELKVTPPRIVAILHNVRSALNVGSMFRTADAAGVEKIYLTGYTPTPEHEKVKKTSLGAEQSVAWEHYRQPSKLLKHLKEQGYQVIALEQAATSKDFRKFKPRYPIALMVGNEVRGINSVLIKKCDASIEIPMRGTKESLNVAVAFGIALYQFE